MKQSIEKGTIYLGGLHGFARIEATKISYELAPYAQYLDAPHLTFLPKGKRSMRQVVEGYEPKIVILEGWGHPDPKLTVLDTESKTEGTFSVKSFTLSPQSFKERDRNFDAFLKKYIKSNHPKILVDSRGFTPKADA